MTDRTDETRDALLISLADAVEIVLRRIHRGEFIDDETAERLAESLLSARYDHEAALRGQSQRSS